MLDKQGKALRNFLPPKGFEVLDIECDSKGRLLLLYKGGTIDLVSPFGDWIASILNNTTWKELGVPTYMEYRMRVGRGDVVYLVTGTDQIKHGNAKLQAMRFRTLDD